MKSFVCAFYLLTVTILCSLHVGCSLGPNAGSGSQTTNGAIVTVLHDSIYGVTGPGMSVELIGRNYNPVLDTGYRESIVIGVDSVFAFAGLDSMGEYRMYIISADSSEGIRIPELSPAKAFVDREYSLSPTGAIVGRVENLSSSHDETDLAVFILGSPFVTFADEQRRFQIHNLPYGDYRVVAQIESGASRSDKSTGPGTNVRVETDRVEVIVEYE